jgi:hypothetical protein
MVIEKMENTMLKLIRGLFLCSCIFGASIFAEEVSESRGTYRELQFENESVKVWKNSDYAASTAQTASTRLFKSCCGSQRRLFDKD